MLILTGMLILIPTVTKASDRREDSLSLYSNDYRILPDSMNIFSNPAYLNSCPQSLEITAADYFENPMPFSSLIVKFDARVTFGITLGYLHPSFFNTYCSANPGNAFKDFNSRVEVDNGAGFIIPEAGTIQTDNILLHFGYAFDRLKFGINASYISLNSQDITENPPPGVTEVKRTSHRDLSINMGLLTEKTGPFDSAAAYLGVEFPGMTRKYTKITATTSDIREINAIDALVYKLGFAGTIDTSPDNSLVFSLNYSASCFPCDSFEHRDNNNDGDFIDAGEEGTHDSLLAQRYSIKFGITDRRILPGNGLFFIGIYGHIYKFKQYADGYNADESRYDYSVFKSNRFTVPIILGGEIQLTDWLIVRICGTKDIVCFTKWYDETTSSTPYTDFTSEEGNSFINAGIGIRYRSFSADLLFQTPWSGNSDPLTGDFNDYRSTKLSLSWKF